MRWREGRRERERGAQPYRESLNNFDGRPSSRKCKGHAKAAGSKPESHSKYPVEGERTVGNFIVSFISDMIKDRQCVKLCNFT